jgi:hypothetical protein
MRLFGGSALLLITDGVNLGLYFGGRETNMLASGVVTTNFLFRGSSLGILLGVFPLLFRGSPNVRIYYHLSKLIARQETSRGVLDSEPVKGALIRNTPECQQPQLRWSYSIIVIKYIAHQ